MDNKRKTKYLGNRLVWYKDDIEEVVSLLLNFQKKEDIENLFDRILTPREINDIARRYKVLKMIDDGASYSDIITETGMSSVTVSRISAKCGYGFRKSANIKSAKKEKPKSNPGLKYKGIKIR